MPHLHCLRNIVKPVLIGHSKIDKTKVLKTNGSLMKVESIAFCNTFNLHKAIIGLENQCLVFFEWPLKTGFTVYKFMGFQSVQKGNRTTSLTCDKYESGPVSNGMAQNKIGLDARKPVFGGLRTTKAQTSLCTRTV